MNKIKIVLKFGLLLTVVSACSSVYLDKTDRSFSSEQSLSKVLYLSKINSDHQFVGLSQQSTGIIRQGETIKLLIDNRNSESPTVYYMNNQYCPNSSCAEPPPEATSHYSFAKKALNIQGLSEKDYTNNAYYTQSIKERKFFDGRIQKFKITENGQEKVYYGLRFIERDLIKNEMLQHALKAVQKSFSIQGANLSLIINSDAQKIDSIKDWLLSQSITVFTMEKLLSGIDYVGLNAGIAYGFLRVDPKDESELEPYDIPLFSSLPLDLAVVAGTITTEYQDVGSHVNLKSKERGTPNMVIRQTDAVEKLRALDGQAIKLVVTHEKFSYEIIPQSVVFEEYNKKINRPWQKVTQVDTDQLIDFDVMCVEKPSDCLAKASSYGGKVAGLGFLANKKVAGMGSALQQQFGYRLNPMGFGVPVKFYNNFIKLNIEKNSEFKRLYELIIESEMGLNGKQPLASSERKKLVEEFKNLILKSEIPIDVYQKTYTEMLTLKNKVDQFYGDDLNKLKIRSSSNAEDIVGFNGAGLHDSYSARIKKSGPNDYNFQDCKFVNELDEDTGLQEEDIEPKSLACAIKASYASLWNLRAIKERSFKRFDHRSATMGLSIQPSYKFKKDLQIKANSVLITRVIGTESVFGQQLSTQVGNGLVTNPVPNTKAELVVISFDSSAKNFGFNLLQYAKPKVEEPALQKMILPEKEILNISKIARDVEVQYCEAKSLAVYHPQGKTCASVVNSAKKALSLDMEFKLYTNGQILIKQVRTFSGK